ncbi:hypothetical protein QZH41_012745, partial [Actinostola sp. cb2023]
MRYQPFDIFFKYHYYSSIVVFNYRLGKFNLLAFNRTLEMAEYPGAEYQMSGYGLKLYNPEEQKSQWVETVKREESIRGNHIVTKGEESVSSSWKIKRPEPLDLAQDTSYFKEKTKHDRPSTYDRINRVVLGYDQKLHRDDREHAKSRGLTVNT